ncbi:matrixin family metalloprotease [Tepidiforma sp.]|uniref:matrixin family metalloprotease n=1 Tax=Tepidiforma sp. TaxID=2682230 RepID=UPI002ADDEB61|nr:matrixin family metalloprotease [Tepidiforma sp.]
MTTRQHPSGTVALRRRAYVGGFAAAMLAACLALGASFGGSRDPAGDPDADHVTRHVLTWADGDAPDPEQPDVSAAFRLNPNRWSTASLPVTVYVNPAGAPPGAPLEALVDDAVRQWSNVEGSAFAFRYGGVSDATAGACAQDRAQRDGRNTVIFVNWLPTGTLGMTCTVWSGGAGGPLSEFDIVLNASVAWSWGSTTAPGTFDLASTVLHELGHGAGIGHPCQGAGATCTDAERRAVMYPSLRSGEQRNRLQDDDRAAIIEAYPGPPRPPVFNRTVAIVVPGVGRD